MATAKNPAAIDAASCPAFIGPRSLPGPCCDQWADPIACGMSLAPHSGSNRLGRQAPIAIVAGVPLSTDLIRSTRSAYLGFRAVPGWLIVLPPGRRLWQVILPDDTFSKVVRIQVALAVTKPGRAAVAGITQVRWHRAGSARPHVV